MLEICRNPCFEFAGGRNFRMVVSQTFRGWKDGHDRAEGLRGGSASGEAMGQQRGNLLHVVFLFLSKGKCSDSVYLGVGQRARTQEEVERPSMCSLPGGGLLLLVLGAWHSGLVRLPVGKDGETNISASRGFSARWVETNREFPGL